MPRLSRYLAITFFCLLMGVVSAQAVTFTVNSTGDGGDSNTGDGICDDGTGSCTLRAAIEQANASVAVADVIHFDIGGGGVQTITPSSRLPFITDALTIDGTTQPGFGGTPIIELDGSSVAGAQAFGLTLLAGGSTVRALVINRFIGNGTGRGISTGQNGGNVIEDNYIGTDVTGTGDQGNTFGVVISSIPNNTVRNNLISGNEVSAITLDAAAATGNLIQDNLIGPDVNGTIALSNGGGTSEDNSRAVHLNNGASNNTMQDNVISGNFGHGIFVNGGSGNLIEGNFIGTDETGTSALGNSLNGVAISGSNNTVGGTTAAARNILSGNGVGITISGGGVASAGNLIQGNYIGTDVTGNVALGNLDGVRITNNAPNNTVGGTTAGAGNLISGNTQFGVRIQGGAATGNALLSNSIFANTSLGIDLGADGVTTNDAGDGDTGPNNRQNFPVLTAATTTSLTGTLNSTPNTTFTLEFFSNTACDSSGHGEGEALLGSTLVMTNGSGDAFFTFSFPSPLALGDNLTATATDPANNTSEFSACLEVAVLEVAIDIKPGSDPNCINNNGHGVIPVAILSSPEFDATQVAPLTVSLEGQAVRVRGNGQPQASAEDVNGDGLDDLVVQIQDVDGTFQEGDTTATLTGETFSGTQIEGTESICIVP